MILEAFLVPFLVFAAALLGAAVPWLARWSHRGLHVALALSAGNFLGAVFLHLLPDLASRATVTAAAHEHDQAGELHGDVHGDTTLWLLVLVGVLLVHVVEAVFLRTTERDERSRHESVSLVTLAGISVHSATAGFGLGALHQGGTLATSFVVAFLLHKALESFAVVNVFMLAEFSRRRIAVTLVLFALVTPLAMVLGDYLLASAGSQVLDLITALATGTFLYVCIAELLPEVFHHREDNAAKIACLAVGVGLSVVFGVFGA